MKKKENYFGRTLEKILLTSEVKNYTVARALSYDVSYISKWISAAALPSRKNAEQIMEIVAETVVSQAKPEALSHLCTHLGVTDPALLRQVLKERLLDAYAASAGTTSEDRYVNNASFTVFPGQLAPFMNDAAAAYDMEKTVHAALLADLFALDHTAKLYLAGIENNRFRIREKRDGLHLNYIISLSDLKGENVYDVILLIHMLTHFSLTDFHLSYSKGAAGKVAFAVENRCAGVTLLSGRGQYLCTTLVTDLKDVRRMYEGILAEHDPDRMIFFSTALDDMLESREYMRALLSRENRWLAGHVTEHLLTRDLCRKLSEKVFSDRPDIIREAERAHLLTVSTMQQEADLLIYDTALTGFVMTGEVDFFNHKVILPPEERKAQLQYMKSVLEDNQNLRVKMVRGGFSDDFKYITNPCMFLSEAADCLRLENGCYENNILLVRDQRLRSVFHTFFEEIWENRPDVVISERSAILEILDSLLVGADVLAGIEEKI